MAEPYDQILHGHWWKFWSRDTDVTIILLYLLKMNKYYIQIITETYLNVSGNSVLS